MKRLTTDNPDGNFETMLNYVYGKEGFAHIRFDGEQDDVLLTSWAKAQCLYRGCDDFPAETPEEIDETLCECVMDCPECPIALAYCFACQAVHLRDRLKLYEDILFDSDGRELVALDQLKELVIKQPNDPLKLEDLKKMKGEPVWVEAAGAREYGKWSIVDGVDIEGRILFLRGEFSCYDYGGDRLAYRRKPEEESKL